MTKSIPYPETLKALNTTLSWGTDSDQLSLCRIQCMHVWTQQVTTGMHTIGEGISIVVKRIQFFQKRTKEYLKDAFDLFLVGWSNYIKFSLFSPLFSLCL
jgi:hypothetical protein